MPELPEVETVVRTLEKLVGYTKIVDIDVYYDKLIDNLTISSFIERLKGQYFVAYKRIGKYLIFELEKDYLIVHLRMEGKFFVNQSDTEYDKKHTHAIFFLEDGRELHYHDTRKFGRMYVYDKKGEIESLPAFKNVGYDAFDERLKAEYLYKVSRKKKITLKQFLLDQRYICGIGNIYANEICFRTSFHPETRVCRLSKNDFVNILDATRIILHGAIKAGGTTIRSYTSSLGVDGRFQLELKVHGREGQTCMRCGEVIEKKMVGGRGTYFCKKCQKRK
ncbi:formamidopyrimidine-DNA glycosylase [Breznakia sp. PF5-3]|uniref:DNA-formamidopyrimidine glycosylase n=1 Tax=unclassified Breznakia TaxID=2623764 RepID=UPI0024065F59|nr:MULTISPECIES: DNA-formamidopyrimidine glycosylase [unclassified Breznakia]MDF9823739.1 formamidopyrimidine-DNA glycosylase [Breznakia sp. PM6-1]MDF9834537.1 formamidopyrimidine-DNA glycosylase [Breznakia sp. PF5-3]MDF9838707.1 formamidopyrimidine-DNA glycosylase [Breznakia sp. PFB2-8]MDF9860738.1 formamidopyrimidine-DNA glycosylase [Breznakia sp. PH5-24]